MEGEGVRWKARREDRKFLHLPRRYTMRKREKRNNQTENFKSYKRRNEKR